MTSPACSLHRRARWRHSRRARPIAGTGFCVISVNCDTGLTVSNRWPPRLGGVATTVSRSDIGSDRIAEQAYAHDLGFDHVAMLQVFRRLAGKADAGWCTGRNDVACLQRQALRQLSDNAWDLEVHLLIAGVLLLNAIDAADDAHVVQLHARRGDDPGSHGAMAIQALALEPLATVALLLDLAGSG